MLDGGGEEEEVDANCVGPALAGMAMRCAGRSQVSCDGSSRSDMMRELCWW